MATKTPETPEQEHAQIEEELNELPEEESAGPGADEPGASQQSLASILKAHNFEFDEDVDDDAIVDRLSELERIAEEKERLEQENLQYRTQLSQRREEPKPEPEPKSAEPPKAKHPEWNEAWEGFLTTDDRGNIVIRDEYRGSVDPSLPEKYVTRKKWERERLQQLLAEPQSILESAGLDERFKSLREDVKQELLDEFRREQAQTQAQSLLNSYAERHASWIYTEDRKFSRIGELFDDRVGYAINKGFSPEEALEYAESVVQRQTGQSPWASDEADEESEPRAKQKRVQLRRKVANGRIPQGKPPKRKGGEPVDPPTSLNQHADQYRNRILQALAETE